MEDDRGRCFLCGRMDDVNLEDTDKCKLENT